jgi:hypothetical protein
MRLDHRFKSPTGLRTRLREVASQAIGSTAAEDNHTPKPSDLWITALNSDDNPPDSPLRSTG